MDEKVFPNGPGWAAEVIRESMLNVRRNRKGKRVEEWPSGVMPVTVKLTVNGVEVPFTETVRTIVDRQNMLVEARAKELALEMLSGVGLDGALSAIQQANVKLARVFNQIAAAIPDEETVE